MFTGNGLGDFKRVLCMSSAVISDGFGWDVGIWMDTLPLLYVCWD